MKPVVLTTEAELEIVEAAAFYRELGSELERAFVDEVERVLNLLHEYPEVGTRIEGDLRRVLMQRFPYRLHYRVEEARVLVLVIAHQHRRPEHGQERR